MLAHITNIGNMIMVYKHIDIFRFYNCYFRKKCRKQYSYYPNVGTFELNSSTQDIFLSQIQMLTDNIGGGNEVIFSKNRIEIS